MHSWFRRPVCGDTADLLIERDLVQELGRHGSIPNVASRDFNCPYFQRFFVDPYVYLSPDTAFGTAMFTCISLAFTFCFDACAIDEQVQWYFGIAVRQAHVQCSPAPFGKLLCNRLPFNGRHKVLKSGTA